MKDAGNVIRKIVANIDIGISVAALLVLITVTFVGVPMRYVLSKPFVWQNEIQMWCMVWVIFFGAGAVFRNGGHVVIEILVDMLPKGAQRFMEALSYVVTMIVLVYLFIQSNTLLAQYVASMRITEILKIPLIYNHGAIPVGCVLMAISYSYVFFSAVFGKAKNDRITEADDR